MNVSKRLENLIDRQYRQPAGIFGRYIGRQMARQHQQENAWSVSLLAIEPEDHILEVGFGPGMAIEMMAQQASSGRIAGIDYSPTMVSVARKRNAQAIKAGRVDLRCGEATALPFTSASFDKTLSIHTLYFWSDPTKALREICRVLRPGGMLVLTFLSKDRWPGGETAPTIAGVYSDQEVAQLMHEAGFAEAHIEPGPEQKPFREIAVVAIN